MRIRFRRPELPVLRTCDVAIIGGSLAGVAAALELAGAGRTVVVVESRTYLGREVTATLRPWLMVGRSPADGLMTALIENARANVRAAESPENPLHMDRVKRFLEDALLEAGVDLLYASLPVGLVEAEDGFAVQGIAITGIK